MTRISYGDELSWDKFEEYVSLSDQNSVVFLKAMRPGEYLVDTIPIRKSMKISLKNSRWYIFIFDSEIPSVLDAWRWLSENGLSSSQEFRGIAGGSIQ